jgi:hypothetical protein
VEARGEADAAAHLTRSSCAPVALSVRKCQLLRADPPVCPRGTGRNPWRRDAGWADLLRDHQWAQAEGRHPVHEKLQRPAATRLTSWLRRRVCLFGPCFGRLRAPGDRLRGRSTPLPDTTGGMLGGTSQAGWRPVAGVWFVTPLATRLRTFAIRRERGAPDNQPSCRRIVGCRNTSPSCFPR